MEYSLRVYYRVVVKNHTDIDLEKHKIQVKMYEINPEFNIEESILHWPIKGDRERASTSESGYVIVRDKDARPYIVLHQMVFVYFGDREELLSLVDKFSDSETHANYVLIELVGTKLGSIEYV